jgi:hypothetical protein
MTAGDKVELRSPEEILATLDERGSLDGLPFMPEMLGYFGRTFTVDAQVERACDTIGYSGVRRLKDTVILDDLRCDGAGHAGCQAQCRIYWKEAWLRPASVDANGGYGHDDETLAELKRIAEANAKADDSTPAEPRFRCQATELLRASEPVGWWSMRSFFHELTSGNVGPWQFVRQMTRLVVEELARRLHLLSAYPFPRKERPVRSVTTAAVGLKPGELVQIRSKREIRDTLTPEGKNRGLWFDREMLPYCGQTARVKTKVERFIDEGSGRLIELASDAYILDDVICKSTRSEGRWFCPRAIYPWWRECWLQPLEGEPAEPSTAAAGHPGPEQAVSQ